MGYLYIKKFVALFVCLSVLISSGCTQTPSTTDTTIPATTPAPSAHVRSLQTPPYGGGEAIIFILDQDTDTGFGDTADQIIRVFGENSAPLNVALTPSIVNNNSDVSRLLSYFDAGIIDISIYGYPIPWLPQSASISSAAYSELKSTLIRSREQFKFDFGEAPAACVFPSASLTEVNYSLLQQSGFKVLCSPASANFLPSKLPVNWSGQTDPDGLYRLPIVGSFEFDSDLLDPIAKSVEGLGIAVIEIQPAALTGKDGKSDAAKLAQLANLIKSSQKLGQITTLENWYSYNALATASSVKQRPLPPYDGGFVIIFRMDDVAKGLDEEVVKEIIKVFQNNGIPVDCGIFSNGVATDLYDIPWLKQYFDQNVVGISINGYDWTPYQLDTSHDLQYLKALRDRPCIDWIAVQRDIPSENLTYLGIKTKLMQARAECLKYFGVSPIAFTVPVDYYDEPAYRAIQDAGFKVFSTQMSNEPYPETDYTVDFSGKRDLGGMYRIPAVKDVCAWGDNCTWTDIIDIGKKASIKDYCKYHDIYQDVYGYNDNTWSICTALEKLGVAAISIHPECFLDRDGKPDKLKLEKLDSLLKWFKSFSTIMTFDQWYRYKLLNKL